MCPKQKKWSSISERIRMIKSPVIIDGSDVKITNFYKYLGVTLQDNLKWGLHVENLVKKGNKKMYHVQCLESLHVDKKIICLFYNSVISTVLTYMQSLHGLLDVVKMV